MKWILFLILGGVCIYLFFNMTNVTAQNKPVNMKELLAKKPGKVIDVRTLDEYNQGHYKDAIHLDWNNGDFEKALPTFKRDETYYLYCASGGRSGRAAALLQQKGIKNVTNLGGYSNLK